MPQESTKFNQALCLPSAMIMSKTRLQSLAAQTSSPELVVQSTL